MVGEAHLVKERNGAFFSKDMMILEEPRAIRQMTSVQAWRILRSLAEAPKYPAQVARELQMYRQRVYYYTRRLEKLGIIQAEKVAKVSGAFAKYYTVPHEAFGVEISAEEGKPFETGILREPLRGFLHPLVDEAVFKSRIIVGSPEPHGPLKTQSRDGHYSAHLALFLGRFCATSREFTVKLDVDVKSEKQESANMLLIGGPGTNLMTAEVNKYLPVQFNEKNYWAGLSDRKGRTYTGATDGVVAKIRNPYDTNNWLIVLAGNTHVGTKASILSLTNHWKEVLSGYRGGEWAVAIRGFDLDGDGKVDSADVLS